VTTDDYPPSALRAGQQGRTSFRLEVGTDGRATACSITQSSGWPELDQTTCRILMHKARFTAALDAGGKPTTAFYANSVLWQIPKD
jgi:protein TonB